MAVPQIDPSAIRMWLRILHEGCAGRTHIAATGAWAGPSFDTGDIDRAVQRVAELDARRPLGIYARITTLRAPLAAGERGGNADSLALPALWADLDIAGPGHKDQNLPPDWAAAEAIVAGSGLPDPSLWIDSGHGAYPIWLLSPPHVMDAEGIADAADLSANWQRVIAAASTKLGWHYGQGVGDLARVLRIPGTVNRKAGTERMCAFAPAPFGGRYTLAALDEACAAAMAAIEPPEPAPVPAAGRRHAAAPLFRPSAPGSEVMPGDDYTERASWAEVLEPHGWRLVRRRGDIGDWCRPGKEEGISATTNALGTDRLHVFTTSTEFDTTSYTKFGAFAVLEHAGSHSAAASALKALGYGRAGNSIEDYLGGLTDTMPPLGPARDADRVSAVNYAPPDVTGAAGKIMHSMCTDPCGPGCDVVTGAGRPAEVPAEPAEVLDARTLAELRYRQEVAAEVRRQRIQKEARKQVTSLEFAATWEEPPSLMSLTEELLLPDDPVRYRIESLLTSDGNAVLAAGFKAGKTTLCNNLLRSLADGGKFLNRFEVQIPEGRIASFNYEVAEGQYRNWLRKVGIIDTDRVCLLNLRGRRLPLTDPQVEDWIVKWLTDRSVQVWVVDPFARAMVGCGDENSNTDVGIVLDILDVIKRRSGVAELILPTHTGRGEQVSGMEHARGATRLDDWADARWLLTTDKESRRFFRAHGRDVNVPEEEVRMDEATGRLTMGGWNKTALAAKDADAELVDWIRANPGLGANEVIAARGGNRDALFARLDSAVSAGGIYRVPAPSGRGKMLHYVTGTMPSAAAGQ